MSAAWEHSIYCAWREGKPCTCKEPSAASVEDWEDCTGSYQVGFSIARGGGIWPSMIDVDATELSGMIAAHDARSLAAKLLAAAAVCEASTEEVFGDA